MRYISMLIVLSLIVSCKSTKTIEKNVVEEKVETSEEKGDLLLTYQRGACFGRCPVFTMEVFEGSVVEYFGRNFTDKEGLWQLSLSKAKQNKMKNLITEADFGNLDTEYASNIPDLPRTTFKFYGDGDEKTVTGRETLPESLDGLKTFLNELIDSNKWKKIEGDPKEEQEEIIYSEILVKFKSNTGLSNWFKGKKDQGIWLKGKVAPDSNIWLVSYKRAMLQPKEALKLIQEDPNVESAEFNKVAKNR